VTIRTLVQRNSSSLAPRKISLPANELLGDTNRGITRGQGAGV